MRFDHVHPGLTPRPGSGLKLDDPSEVKEILKSLDLYVDLIEDEGNDGGPARSPPHSRGLGLSLDLTESQIPLDEIHLN